MYKGCRCAGKYYYTNNIPYKTVNVIFISSNWRCLLMKTDIIKQTYNPYGELIEEKTINVSQYCEDIRDAIKHNAKILVENDVVTITSVYFQYIYK